MAGSAATERSADWCVDSSSIVAADSIEMVEEHIAYGFTAVAIITNVIEFVEDALLVEFRSTSGRLEAGIGLFVPRRAWDLQEIS